MFRKLAAAALAGLTVIALPGCAASTSGADAVPRKVDLGYGAEILAGNTTTRSITLPASALLTSGPFGLQEKLKAYGVVDWGRTQVWIDGTRSYGAEVMNTMPLDEIARVDVVRGVWSGLRDNPLAAPVVISITTKRALEDRK